MRAWRVEAFGDPAGLRIHHIDAPARGAGEVHVAVAYTAVNFADGLMVRGTYQVRPPLPFSPGFEVSGTVIEADHDSGFRPGDAVCGQVAWGGYAEEVVASASRWLRVPEGVDLAAAAALPVSYVTAHVALFDRAALRPRDALVVLAAAGGVGRAALQLAAGRLGPTIALVGDDRKADIAMGAGATHVVNYRRDDWVARARAISGGAGIDVVLDPVGGDRTIEAIRTLAWRGRILIVGFASGGPASLPANRLLVKAASAHGVFWSHDRDADLVADVQRDLGVRWRAGAIGPLVSDVLPFAELPSAIAAIESGGTVGKLVLKVG